VSAEPATVSSPPGRPTADGPSISAEVDPHRLRTWTYKPALDGLRAVAVLAVLLYHGGVSWAQGGFLGVDLFFALSGYLITALLLAERAETGGVDAKSFWVRRAKRLLPALFLLVLVLAAYVALFASAEEAQRLRADGTATILYVANWWYAFSGASYFEAFRPSMFRHTWSLGIEEQFYVLWPLLFIGGMAWLKGRTKHFAIVVIGCALVSAAVMFMLYAPDTDPSRVFYGTDTRAQALLLGAALALLLHGRDVRQLTERWGVVLGAAALVACLAMFGLTNDHQGWLYQGGFFLMGLIAVACIVSAAGPQDTVLNRGLSWKPLVWIGMVSYGLYLWHWPIFVFLDENRTHLEGPALLALRFGVTFIVAALSFYLIEKPVRRIDFGARRFTLPILGATVFAAVLFFGTTTFVSGIADPLSATSSRAPEAHRVLLVGDSTAFSLGYNYSGAGRLNLTGAAMLGCGVVRGSNVPIDRAETPESPKCSTWPEVWKDAKVKSRPELVLMEVGAWEVFDKRAGDTLYKVGTDEWKAYVLSELDAALQVSGGDGTPVVMLNSPCFKASSSLEGKPNPERNDASRVQAVNDVVTTFAQSHPQQVTVLDLKSFLCPNGQYQDELGGVQVRDDGVHYTKDGAALVWNWLVPQIEPLFPGATTGSTTTTAPAGAKPKSGAGAPKSSTTVAGGKNAKPTTTVAGG